jgi:hypothetical protein
MTRAIRVSLEERLARERQQRKAEIERRRAAINAIVERFSRLHVLDDRSEDEILGYDEHGLPTRRSSTARRAASVHQQRRRQDRPDPSLARLISHVQGS